MEINDFFGASASTKVYDIGAGVFCSRVNENSFIGCAFRNELVDRNGLYASVLVEHLGYQNRFVRFVNGQFNFKDVFLFGGTIKENIAYGKPGASSEEIEAAANKANAFDFINSFLSIVSSFIFFISKN